MNYSFSKAQSYNIYRPFIYCFWMQFFPAQTTYFLCQGDN
ncbi:hypothetical protein VCNHCC008D_000196 [Vibrio cholerae O1 str. NHCC-008D]|nr:hypothetical protein VCNHCC008D_000196 [Vibrio cholerae O1 str. NHCC-008D]